MKLFDEVPSPLKWVLRIAGWTIGLFIIGAIVLRYGNFKLAQHVRECLMFGPRDSYASMIASTQQLLACVHKSSGPLERLLLYRSRKAIEALPNAPCRYVGVWTATRPGSVYKITLKDDSQFIAEPQQGSTGDVISGSWGVHKDTMIWLYDQGQLWPPDMNDIKHASEEDFSLVEADRSRTRYVLAARTTSAKCTSVTTRTAPPAIPAGPAKMRPAEGLSQAQKADYEQLHFAYIETFRTLGRARTCQHPAAEQRLQDLLAEMARRHGENDPILMTAMLGFVAGNENRLVGNEKDQSVPPTPVPCEVNAGQMNGLRLPDIPASLVLRPGEPVERVRREGSVATGPYRFVTRSPGDKGVAEHLVIHREKVAFSSTQEFEHDRLLETPTPVLVIATRDQSRKCRDGKPYFAWHAVSLPSWGDSIVGPLEGADCMVVWPYTDNDGRTGLCAWMNTESDRRPSQLYAVEASGKVVKSGERPVGVCPK